jgi:hypothetical protein
MYLGLKQRCSWAVATILICAVRLASAQSPAANIRVLNLRDYGWQVPDPLQPREGDAVERRSIAVDHNGRVLVAFTVRERSGLVTREQPALSLHIIRFSPAGKADPLLSLLTNGWRSNSIYLSDSDEIIVRANDTMQFWQVDPGNAEKGSWKALVPCSLRRCRVKQSPTGRTLLLYTVDADPPLTIIRASQPPTLRRCGKAPQSIGSFEDKIQNYPQSITDEFAYFSGQTRSLDLFTYRWPLCDYEHRVEMPLHIQGRFTVLKNESFVSNADFATNALTKPDKEARRTLVVTSSDGQVKFRQHMKAHESWDNFWVPIRSSERGNRMAVDLLTMRGGNQSLDISSHVTERRIAVYDIEAGKELASIPVNPKHQYRFEFDLSPDGHRLAILEDDTVKIVDIE